MQKIINLAVIVIVIVVLIPQQIHAQGVRKQAEDWSAKDGSQYAVASTDPDDNPNATPPPKQVIGIANGNWLDYSISTSGAGNYSFTFRVATTQSSAQFQIKSGSTVLKTVNIPNTGGWDVWQGVTVAEVALASGTQTIRILSVNNETCNFNWMEYAPGGVNQTPTAHPGDAQTINLPATQVTLSGSGTDNDGTIASYAWTQESGTAASITSPSSASTTITGLSTTGVRVFRLTVTDNLGATGSNDVSITVGPDLSPSVNAGGNQTISLPATSVTLSGSAIPNNGGTITFYEWTKISGNVSATINSPSSAITTISGLASAGTWIFRLTAKDNQNHSAYSDAIITVQSNGGVANYWSINSSMGVYYTGGKVGIGTDDPQSMLAVKGEITSKKVRVTQLGWSDYVFEKKYRLPSLMEVEEYIAKHKHLPEVPSAAEVEKQGIDLGDNQSLLLRKIEELTLYAITANKKMEQQQGEIKLLQEQLKKIQEQLAKKPNR